MLLALFMTIVAVLLIIVLLISSLIVRKKECPMCGEVFTPQADEAFGFFDAQGNVVLFCSSTCYQRYSQIKNSQINN